MEIVEVDASVVVRGMAKLTVHHHETGLNRGLEHREPVVLRTATGEMYAAQVWAIDFEVEDTLYTLAIGARLPGDLALERVEGLDWARHDLAMHELVDLLGRLRSERARGPRRL
ncbi:hypothetical protein GCM10009795_005330 [Nocardioides hankookensis]|uniref:Uncharacterized protein n=1 Tax=Nocardioides hankookensis TaxID=443157 RepID=A0ABW1LFH2_9ACTN